MFEYLPVTIIHAVLVTARLVGIVAILPIDPVRTVNLRVRLIIVLLLAMVVTPATLPFAHPDLTEWSVSRVVVAAAIELAVGLVLGLGVLVLLFGIQVAGQLISQMAGLSLSAIYSPSGESMSAFTRLLDFVASAIFLLLGGHRLVVGRLLQTFAEVAPGTASIGPETLEILTALLTQSFLLGLQSVLPLLATLGVSNLLAAMLGRLMPQMNVLLLSSGLNSLALFAAVLLGIGGLGFSLESHLEPLVAHVAAICGG